ncbi:MAG: T9SS type A sorting domain-containing protein [Candidatus Kapabacteria bacterium]|jgi:hypothetical protein|nr:T9SS type A sorting domain-containing protein [Candidatus Kapabacteria bacterium]
MKKLQTLLLTVLAMLFIVGYSNAEDRRFRWYIPINAGVSFDSTDGKPRYMDGFGPSPVVTWDQQGNTLFLTNHHIYDKNHNRINDKFIHEESYWYSHGEQSGTNSMSFPMVVLMPGSDSLVYCVFSFDQGLYDSFNGKYHGANLYFSVIKFDVDYTKCEFLIHRQILDTELCHQIALCRHSNGSDIWAVSPKFYNGNYISYLLTDKGVVDTVISSGAYPARCYYVHDRISGKGVTIGPYHNTFGQMKSTIDGNTIARALIDSSLVEYSEFNKTTGVLSNIKRLKNLPDNKLKWVSSLEFSANGRYLYANGHQFDLELGSADVVYQNAEKIDLLPAHPYPSAGYGHFFPVKQLTDYQMGPDQKIYFFDRFSYSGYEIQTQTICAIENPNSPKAYVKRHLVPNPPGPDSNFTTDLPEYAPWFNETRLLSIITDTVLCLGTELRLHAMGMPNSSYEWTGPDGWTSDLAEPVRENVTDEMAGRYYLRIYRDDEEVFDSLDVVVTPLPIADITADGGIELCEYDSRILQNTEQKDYYIYEWSTGETSATITIDEPGIYILSVTDTISGCEQSDEITFVPKDISPEIEALDPVDFCEGDSCELRTLETYDKYVWSTGDTSATIKVGRTNTYFVTVIDAEGCTGRSNIIKITVRPRPDTEIEGQAELCAGTTESYRLKEFSGECEWTVENGTISGGQGTAEITVLWDISGIGKVRAEQPADNGCPGLDSIIVNIFEIPTPKIMPEKKVICADGNIVLYTQESYSEYLWSNGETSASFTVTQPGTYSVEVTNAGGCVGSSEEMSVIKVELPIPILTGDLEICPGSETTIGLADIYEAYLWSDGSTKNEITLDKPGDYSVEVTDTNGCSNYTDFTISQIIMSIDGIADIDFGDKSPIGFEKEIKLINNSGRKIHANRVQLQSGYDFTFRTEPLLPCDIAYGDNLYIYIKIDQSSTGIKSDSLFVVFDQPCDTTISCKLNGNILPRILVSLPDKNVEVNEYDDIELSAKVIFGEEELSGNFSMEYSAISSFFAPDPNQSVVDNELRIISHSGNTTIGLEETKLAGDRVLILLSNSDSTDLTIERFEWIGDPAIIELQNGRLRSNYFCAKEIRPVVFFDVPFTVSPNPATEFIELKFIEDREGQVLINVYNVTGQRMLSQTYNKTQKEQSFPLDLSELSSGAYSMVVYIEGKLYKHSAILVRR